MRAPDRLRSALVTLVALAAPSRLDAQPGVDRQLRSFIHSIQAIDNHSHVRAATGDPPGAGPKKHPLGDSWPFLEDRLRSSNPQFVDAWKALYGYRFRDTAHVADALAEKAKLMSSLGDGYPAAILDRLGIAIALVNAPAL